MSDQETNELRGFTVIPLMRLNLEAGLSIPFGADFVLKQTPDWLKSDALLSNLSFSDQQVIRDSDYSFIAEYEANAIGERHPKSTEKEPLTLQKDKSNAAAMANLALWLVQPCSVSYTSVLHGLRHPIHGKARPVPILQQLETHTPIYCHPDDVEKVPSVEQLERAGKLCDILRLVEQGNAVWTAIRSFWSALLMRYTDIRYSLFWIGLEALFGPDNSGSEITYKLSQRIAFFISNDPISATEEFRRARECYQMRSKIVHGRWMIDPKTDLRIAETEEIVRRSIFRILANSDLREVFLSKGRDSYLEEMIYKPLWAADPVE